ncbi:hypothetical protein BH23DEI1_BH23DEI1_21840 [soil metagenome]
MNEHQAWEAGKGYVERLAAEADVVRQVRGSQRGPTEVGTVRRGAASAARLLALLLTRFADALESRRGTLTT